MWVLPTGCSSSQTAPAWVPSMGCSPSGTDCSSVGPPRGHKSCQKTCSSVGSSLHGATGPARSLLQHELPTGSQPPSGTQLLRRGVLPRLQFFMNCSRVGPLHGLQSFRHRMLQRGSPAGSQVLPGNLLHLMTMLQFIHAFYELTCVPSTGGRKAQCAFLRTCQRACMVEFQDW